MDRAPPGSKTKRDCLIKDNLAINVLKPLKWQMEGKKGGAARNRTQDLCLKLPALSLTELWCTISKVFRQYCPDYIPLFRWSLSIFGPGEVCPVHQAPNATCDTCSNPFHFTPHTAITTYIRISIIVHTYCFGISSMCIVHSTIRPQLSHSTIL